MRGIVITNKNRLITQFTGYELNRANKPTILDSHNFVTHNTYKVQPIDLK